MSLDCDARVSTTINGAVKGQNAVPTRPTATTAIAPNSKSSKTISFHLILIYQYKRVYVEVLELPMQSSVGQSTIIHPTLIWDDDTAVLVDAGFPGRLQQIREAMGKAGVPFDRFDKVIVTHQDIDHIGSLPDIVRESSHKVEVLCHEEERPYIKGRKPLIKIHRERMSKMLWSLPEEERQQMEVQFADPPKVSVDMAVADEEVLPYYGGITVIFTPGHTPGHICL